MSSGPIDAIRIVVSRCTAFFRRRKLDEDFDEELRAHIELAVKENIENGMPGDAARTKALVEFGGVTQLREEYRLRRGLPFIETLLQDLRFALRQLRRSPGLATSAILTLALGIGASTAIFSVVEGVALAPLPYPRADRLMILLESRPGVKQLGISYPDYQDWQRDTHSFEHTAAVAWRDYVLNEPGAPEHVHGMEVSSGLFSTLGVKLMQGREISPAEDKRDGAPVAIISDRLWRERFLSRPQSVGRAVTMDGEQFTVIGVLPPGFRLWSEADVYTSLERGEPLLYSDRTIHALTAIGRLRTGVGMGEAAAELSSIQQNLDGLYPSADRNLGANVMPLKQSIVGDAGGTLFLLLGAVGIVLLIACTNVANLLLAHAAARTREFAIRSAMGASQVRVVRQLLTESILLAFTGGVLAVGLAKAAIKVMVAYIPSSVPRTANIGMNLPVLLFAFGVSLAVGVVFGLAPAFRGSRVDVQGSLKAGERGSTQSRSRSQSALVIIQMALTLILLVGSGLLLRTIRDLWNVNPGFNTGHVITFQVGLSPSLTQTASSTRTAYQQLLGRIRRIPGVQAVDFTNIVPLSERDNGGPFWIGAQQSTSMQDAPHALYFETGPDYLQTMGIPLLRGRFFTAADDSGSAPVVVIDSVLARTYFAGKDPIGKNITVAHWRTARVIGIVGHVRHWGMGDPGTYNPSQIYISFYQISDEWVPSFARDLSVAVRTPLAAGSIMPAIRSVVYDAANDQAVFNVQTMQQIVSDSMASQRLPMILLAAFAVLALVLASVGIYGVIFYSVTLRVQEIGIRMALGADRRDVLRMVLGQGLSLAFAGLVVGAAGSLVLARMLSSFAKLLYGVRTSDPLTFVAASLVLTGSALVACYLPARRAMHIDPMRALRTE
jgi:predicted permease